QLLCHVAITRDITERRRTERRLALQYAVTQILSESLEVSEGAQKILRAACETLDWEVGVLWKIEPGEQVLRCVEICHHGPTRTPEFDHMTQTLTFAKGVGLAGKIWQRGKPYW